MKELWVGCRKATCAWRGKMAEYESHPCPYEPYRACSKEVLQELYFYDERIRIKVNVLEEVGRRAVNDSINVDYLSLSYVYMTRYETCQEIQHVGLDILGRIGEKPNGVALMLSHCYNIRDYLPNLIYNEYLKNRAERLIALLGIADGVSVVNVLARLASNS